MDQGYDVSESQLKQGYWLIEHTTTFQRVLIYILLGIDGLLILYCLIGLGSAYLFNYRVQIFYSAFNNLINPVYICSVFLIKFLIFSF